MPKISIIDIREAATRAARTFAQAALGIYLAGVQVDAVADLSLIKKAAAAGVIAVLTFVHNAIEDVFPEVDSR